MKRIGVIGVGLLGQAVASRLLQAKFTIKGFDIRSEQIQALEANGLIPAGNVAEAAAGADAVFTILPSPESVETTVLGRGGLTETAPRNCTLIQMSTISPDLTRRLAEAANARGLGFLDAPVSGTSAMVAKGDCVVFVAGERAKADASRSLLDAIAKKTIYLGDAGLASLAKLAANLLVGLNTAALAEAFVLATKGGLAPDLLLEALIDSAADSKMLQVRGPLMASHRFDTQMKIALFLKDFKLMLDEGMRLGVPLPLTSLTQQLTSAANQAGRGEEDLAAILTTLERLAGLGADPPLNPRRVRSCLD